MENHLKVENLGNHYFGSGQFIPGFEDQLIGFKAGDKTNVNVKFPDTYHNPD